MPSARLCALKDVTSFADAALGLGDEGGDIALHLSQCVVERRLKTSAEWNDFAAAG